MALLKISIVLSLTNDTGSVKNGMKPQKSIMKLKRIFTDSFYVLLLIS